MSSTMKYTGSLKRPIGQNIYGLMLPYVTNAVDAMKGELQKVTLDMLIDDLQETLKTKKLNN